MTTTPSERLLIPWPAGIPWSEETEEQFNAAANRMILAKGDELRARGERPWMRVLYVGVPGRQDSTDTDADMVEVDPGGTITTVEVAS